MVAWEVAICRIRSACDIGLEHQNLGISLWQYNLLKESSTKELSRRFLNELRLESVRQRCSSKAVSRLRGVYFFKSEEDAYKAVDRWGIPERRKFVSAVNFSASNLTEVDSEWITWRLNSDEADWMEKYWGGEPYGETPLTEVLASGIGIVQNLELREAAYRRIMESFPESTSLLAMACCGFQYSKIDSIAQAVPGVIREEGGIKVSFYIYIGDLDTRQNDLMTAIDVGKARNELPPIIRPADPKAFFRMPDLTKGEFLFRDSTIIRLFDEVHASVKGL